MPLVDGCWARGDAIPVATHARRRQYFPPRGSGPFSRYGSTKNKKLHYSKSKSNSNGTGGNV
eukprot:4069680-Pyramimonas_sp.AAC.1